MSQLYSIRLRPTRDPANDGTPNAVVNRLRVTPDIDANGTGKLDTIASGQPISVVVSKDFLPKPLVQPMQNTP